MPIINISKEQELYIEQADFKEKHRVFPEEAQVARAIVNGNLDIINHFIATDLVTEDRLDMTLVPEPRLNYYYENYLENDFYGAEE